MSASVPHLQIGSAENTVWYIKWNQLIVLPEYMLQHYHPHCVFILQILLELCVKSIDQLTRPASSAITRMLSAVPFRTRDRHRQTDVIPRTT